MDKQKQIEEMNKDIAIRTAMAKSIVGSMNNGVEGWLAEYLVEKGWAKIQEGAVVLTREEFDELQKGIKTYNYTAVFEEQSAYRWEQGYWQGTKETAEKFARLVEFHSVSTRDENGREIFTISALGLKEILHEEFGIPYDEIEKEITEGK